MQRSSVSREPTPFRGFGLCVAAILAGYIALIASLGYGIKRSLDEAIVASTERATESAEITGSIRPIEASASK